MATLPPPPGLLSTMMDWPSPFSISAASVRATIDELPPGANGTTSRIGFVGQVCACAGTAKRTHAARSNRRNIGGLCGVVLLDQRLHGPFQPVERGRVHALVHQFLDDLDRPAGLQDLVGAHGRVADEDHLVVVAVLVKDVPGARALGVATAVVLPDV